MDLWKLRRIVTVVALVGLLLCLGAAGALRWKMQSALDESCSIAQAAHPHPGDDVAALVDYAGSPSHTLRERNRAVWALGQARDPRALPLLEGRYTGARCHHAHRLCERELEKAIACCKGPAPNLLLLDTPKVATLTE